MTLLKCSMNMGRIKAKVGGPAVRALPLVAIALAVLVVLGPDGQRPAVHAQASRHESITGVTLSANELSEGAGTQTITLNVTMDTATRLNDTPLSSRGARLCMEGVGAQKGEDGDFTSFLLVPFGSEYHRPYDADGCQLFNIQHVWGSEFPLKVRVNILEDTIDEPYEDIRFTLQNGSGLVGQGPDLVFSSLSGSSAELTIRDNDGLAGPTVSNQRTHEDQPYALTFPAVVDPQGSAVSYTAALKDGSSLPDWLTFDGATRTFSGTPDDIGVWPIRVTASGSGYPGASIFNLTVFTDVALGQVANPRQHENGTDYVTLHWDATPKADRYLVQWREAEAQFSLDPEWSATVAGSDSPSYTISELPSGVTLQVRVTAQRDTVPDGPASAELQVSTQGAARSFNDYDADDDGLIEITTLEQLNAIRWDPDGDGDSDNDGYAVAFPDPAANNGCRDGACQGYELSANLDFDDSASYASGEVNSAWTSGAGWYPIGDYHTPWNSTLSGSGHTISNLLINRGSHGDVGLFAKIGNRGSVRHLGLAAPSVASGINTTGALVGENKGRITAVYGADVDVRGRKAVGGLVGSNVGTVERSYVTGSVSGSSHNVGGVVGWNAGGTIQESYVTAAVHGGGFNTGGLTGRSDNGGTVLNSYSTGRVSGGNRVGGLIALGGVSHSYYDTQTSGRSGGVGPKTTVELKGPTTAAGIYANWDSDLWDFGTAADYPLLSVDFDGDGTASWQEFGQQTRTPNVVIVDYDADDDNLIEISNLEQLNAIRWDLDGNGISNNSGHAAAFPNPAANYGCRDATCEGYELAADLDFDDPASYASGEVNTAWTSGAGWQPISGVNDRWHSNFDGSGHTISNLFINRGSTPRVGLFGAMAGAGHIRRLGLVDANVTGGFVTGALVGDNRGGSITYTYASATVDGGGKTGVLVGDNHSGGRIKASYVTGTVKYSGIRVGGMVGNNSSGVIEESYSTASASGRDTIGGLVGMNEHRATIRNSYSTGHVSGTTRFVGGLISANHGDSGVSQSYYDTQTSGRSGGLGPKTTAELQSPTAASGIYANWNSDLWDFGTASDYPLLSVDFDGDGTASWQEFGQQTRTPPPPPATVAMVRFSTEPGVDGTFGIGDSIEIMVAFSEDVAVTGAPQLTLDFDGTARTAAYHSAGGGTVVFFTYTVAEGDVSSSGVGIPANALILNGGSIAGLTGVAADLAHEAVAPSKFRRVDGVRPTISSGSVSEDGRQVSVVFNEAVQTSPLLQSFIDKLELPPAFQFIISVLNVEVDGTWPKQTNAVVSGNTVTFTMDQAITSGQEVQVRYDGVYARYRAAVMMDKNGNHVANFGPTAITNNSTVTADAGASGVTISSRDIEVKEGQSASYNVRLREEPTGPVTVAVAANNPDNVTISPMKLEFDAETWDTDQRVTITSETDDGSLGYWMRVRHTATGSGYTGQDTIRVLMRE